MPDMMTTTDKFPTVDITHKPKRSQGDNLKNANIDPDSPVEGAEISTSDIPTVLTVERAIRYYESHAEGELKSLYSQTAKWLTELIARKLPEGVDIDKAAELMSKLRGGKSSEK